MCSFKSQPNYIWFSRQRCADIENHLNVCTNLLLSLHSNLWREAMVRAVISGLKRHTIIINLWVKGKNLESTRVSERETIPTTKGTETTKLLNNLGTWSQHQVVRVTKNNASTDICIITRTEVLHCTASTDRHKARGLICAAMSSSSCRTRCSIT